MPRRPRIDFWGDALPVELEWALVGVAFVGWLVGSSVYYFSVMGRMHRVLEVFGQIGLDPNSGALTPVAETVLYLAPLAGLPLAFGVWKAVRGYLLKKVFSGI